MREIMLAGSYWLHSIATVVWLGGIFFILFIAIPSAKQILGAEASKFMGEISRRFTPLANYSIIALLVTGTALTAVNRQYSGIGNLSNSWSLILIMKLFLALGMISVHFYRGLVLAPKVARTESAAKKAFLQKLSLNLVKVNLCVGLLVLLLSGIASVI